MCLVGRCDLTLSKPHRRGWREVLQGVSFDLHAGEILGIGGLLGSGRTEILETHLRLDDRARRRADSCRRRCRRHSLAARRAAARASPWSPRTARRRACICSRRSPTMSPCRWSARLARFGMRSFASEAGLARRAVQSLGIRCTGIDQTAGTLSGGNQQKVVIGKWLATRPRVLLLDEPTRGIDVGAKREIYDLIFRLARERRPRHRRGQLGTAGAAAARRPHPGDVGGPADGHCSRAPRPARSAIMQLAAPRARRGQPHERAAG